jgi:hypothetical protein
MELKNEEENPIRYILRDASVHVKRLEIEVHQDKEHRTFHEQPAYLVVDGGTPFIRTHLSIPRVHKIQGHEHNKTYQEHNVQQVIKEFNGVDIFHTISVLFLFFDRQTVRK